MRWSEEYATGVPEVDKQHQALFAFSEEFRDVLENGFGAKTYDLFLEFLDAYAEAHFSYEDKCMMAHKCPVADRNRREHGGFRKMVAREQAAYAGHGFDRDRALKLLTDIDRWLMSHICRVDVQLRDCVGDDSGQQTG